MGQLEIGKNTVVRWSPAAVATEVNEEVVLMNLERDRCYGLGSTGSDIWRKLQAPIRVSELLAQLEAEYDAPAGQMELDVLQTLREFAAEGLIEACGLSE